MMQGFEQSFVVGFLLTAMPAFTHGPRCHPLELLTAALLLLGFGAAALVGALWLAEPCFMATIAFLLVAGLRRVLGNPRKPPKGGAPRRWRLPARALLQCLALGLGELRA